MSLDYFITIKDGVASTTAPALNTNPMVVVDEGEIDLKTERLNLSVKPVPKEGIRTRLTGKVNVNLSVLTRPFKLYFEAGFLFPVDEASATFFSNFRN